MPSRRNGPAIVQTVRLSGCGSNEDSAEEVAGRRDPRHQIPAQGLVVWLRKHHRSAHAAGSCTSSTYGECWVLVRGGLPCKAAALPLVNKLSPAK